MLAELRRVLAVSLKLRLGGLGTLQSGPARSALIREGSPLRSLRRVKVKERDARKPASESRASARSSMPFRAPRAPEAAKRGRYWPNVGQSRRDFR